MYEYKRFVLIVKGRAAGRCGYIQHVRKDGKLVIVGRSISGEWHPSWVLEIGRERRLA